MTIQIRNLNSGTTKTLTFKMPDRTGLLKVSTEVETDGLLATYKLYNAADSRFPLVVTMRIRYDLKKDVTVFTWRYTSFLTEEDADSVTISARPVEIVTTIISPGVTGIAEPSDLVVFLQNAWGLLFKTETAGAINPDIMAMFGNGVPGHS